HYLPNLCFSPLFLPPPPLLSSSPLLPSSFPSPLLLCHYLLLSLAPTLSLLLIFSYACPFATHIAKCKKVHNCSTTCLYLPHMNVLNLSNHVCIHLTTNSCLGEKFYKRTSPGHMTFCLDHCFSYTTIS